MYEDLAVADRKPGLIRRRVLQLGGAAAIIGLAGCTDDDNEDDETPDDEDENGDDEGADEEEEEADEPEDDDENGGDQEEQDLSVTAYSNGEYGYELEVPEAWTINEADPADVYFYGSGPNELVVTTLAYPPGSTLDELTEDAIANSERFPGFELLGQEDTTIESGEEARIIDWQYSPVLTPVLYRTKFLVVVTDGGIAYSVEIGTDIDEYDDEFDAFGADVLTSFEITDLPDISDVEISEYEIYEDERLGYSFDYPAAWEVVESLEGDVTISDEFSIRYLSVLTGPMGGKTREEWADEFRTEIDADPTIDLLDERSTTVASSHDATILDVELREDSVYRGSYVLVADEESDIGYMLVPATDEALYDEMFEEISERALDSFTIDDAQTQNTDIFAT